MSKNPSVLTRRRFLTGSGGVAVLGTVAGSNLLSRTARAAAWMMPDTSPESPSASQLSTMRALADAILPNWDGSPGALESEAIQTLNDPYYGINPYISELVSDVNDWAATFWVYGRSFTSLDHGEKDECIAERLGYDSWPASLYKDAYLGVIALTKLNYFGGLVNSVGTNYIGFPGPSEGYAGSSAAGAYQSTDTPKAIPDNNTTGINSYITVSGPGTVKDLKVTVYIPHTYQGDLIVRLYAPNGTVHYLWNGQGGSADNVILHDVPVSTFNGLTAAGTWRLNVYDRYANDLGTLKFWSFKLRTRLDGPAVFQSTDTPIAIPDNNATGITSNLAVTAPGTVTSAKVTAFINHTWRGDLVVKLRSPAGTEHVLWNRAGGSADDLLLNNVPVAAFNGQVAAGTWRLQVIDQAGADVGSLRSWTLELMTHLDG
jgi:subtilisin-like proprotein convertase family protein